MRAFVRVASIVVGTMILAFVGYVAQSGLEQTNRNLCELWASLPLPIYESCEFQQSLLYLLFGGAILIAFWLLLESYWLLRLIMRKLIKKRQQWKSTPPSEQHLSAYIRSSALVQRLDEKIAQNAKLPIKPDETTAFREQEIAKFFGIDTIDQLDKLLEENQESIIWISSYSFTEDHTLRGSCVVFLFDVLAIQLGEDSLRKLNMLRRLTHFTEHGIQNTINAYREFCKQHKVKVRVPLVPDFNLITIEEGLFLAQQQCRGSAVTKSLPKNVSVEGILLAYIEYFKRKMVFYGSLQGHRERSYIGYRPGQFSFMSPILNPRFEAGRVVIDSQFFGSDEKGNPTASNVTYDRLYVLRPDLMRVIDKLNEADTHKTEAL